MKKKWSVIALSISLMLIVNACGYTGTENTHTSTVAPTTAEITTEEIESTEQAEAFSYQIEYGAAINYKDSDKYFALFTSPEDIDKLDGVSQEMNAKYDEKWFETHSFAFIWLGHGSCCFADVNQVQFQDGCLTVSINFVKKGQEDLYKEKGKDYQLGEGGNHHNEAAVSSCIIIEFDKNGEEMLGLLETLIYKVRDWPSRDDVHVGELRLRNPEVVESTEQTDPPSHNFAYEAVYSGSWGVEGGDKDGFLLVTSREEIDNFVRLDPQSNEKYSSEWFETHALICVKFGHSSCDVAALNRIEAGERTMIIFIDSVHNEESYKEHGKEYEVPGLGSGMHNAAEGYTKFFIEFDKDGKEFVKSVKAAMVKWRDYPSSKWRAGLINLGKEEQ